MNDNEVSKLYRLTSPFLPRVGETFLIVAAGVSQGSSLPAIFAEFFAFSTRGECLLLARRSHIGFHLLLDDDNQQSRVDQAFRIALARGRHELLGAVFKDEIGACPALPSGPCLVVAEWREVTDLYQAALLHIDVLRDLANRTKSSAVHARASDAMHSGPASFENAVPQDGR